MARSLAEIAADGAGALYEGRIAAEILRVVAEDALPGTLTAAANKTITADAKWTYSYQNAAVVPAGTETEASKAPVPGAPW